VTQICALFLQQRVAGFHVGIEIDWADRVARRYFTPIPLVVGTAGELVEEIENAKGIPESPISLRTVPVPGIPPENRAGFRGGWDHPSTPLEHGMGSRQRAAGWRKRISGPTERALNRTPSTHSIPPFGGASGSSPDGNSKGSTSLGVEP